jgi:hypothetical protein
MSFATDDVMSYAELLCRSKICSQFSRLTLAQRARCAAAIAFRPLADIGRRALRTSLELQGLGSVRGPHSRLARQNLQFPLDLL